MAADFPVPVVWLLLAAPSCWLLWKVFFEPSVLPDLPIIGYDPKKWFAWPRLLFKSFNSFRELYSEANEKYLSKGKPFIMPELNDTHVVLPLNLAQWLVDQPDSVLSSRHRQMEFLQTDYTFPVPKIVHQPHHVSVIKGDLTRRLNTLTTEIWEELGHGFDSYWGNDTKEWREVNVFETIIRIVTRTSNRVFVGEELCANEEYLKMCTAYAQDVPVAGIVIRLIPSFLQPLLAPLITLPNRYHVSKIRSILRPEIDRRLQLARSGKDGDDVPNDFLQWYTEFALKSLEAEETTPQFLADRIAAINFAAIHTSTFTSVNALYDILSSRDKDAILSQIQDEILEIQAADGAAWTTSKTSVQRMAKADAVLRESMRYSTFMTGALNRTVMAKNGVTTPDGVHIKQGVVLAVPAWPIQRTAEHYPDPNSFLPFRFLRPAAATSTAAVEIGSGANGNGGEQQRKTTSTNMVDTSLTFLNFGHGRHVCPGRFFAANELKLLIAYMAVHYDIEPLAQRPEPIAFGSVMTPNPSTSIRVRRRKL